jgi:uncharacterized protein YjdB
VTGITITAGTPTGGTITSNVWTPGDSGETLQLTAVIAPSNATNQTITWSSSDTTSYWVTVSSSGLITIPVSATANGQLYTITAKANDGSGITATFNVKIPGGEG